MKKFLSLLLLIATIFTQGCFIDDLWGTGDDDNNPPQEYKAPEPNPPTATRP